MSKLTVSLLLLGVLYAAKAQSPTTASGSHAPAGPYTSGQLLFEEHFDELDQSIWAHEITLGGGGNAEFEWYTNDRKNTFIKDSQLHVKPTLVADEYGEEFLYSGEINLGDECTNNDNDGCYRHGQPTRILNPIKSGRLRTVNSFSFKYGKVEIKAKAPVGDWLWPALWLLPTGWKYGGWPASGEIDMMESRGNWDYTDGSGSQIGCRHMGSTLHWGPAPDSNRYSLTTVGQSNDAGYNADFHSYQLEWTPDYIQFKVDGHVLNTFAPPDGGFWEWGQLSNSGHANPWQGATKMAPFDQEFHIIINNAIGGNFFPDNANNAYGAKPWKSGDAQAMTNFWWGKDQWLPGWQLNEGDQAALQIDYIRVWAI